MARSLSGIEKSCLYNKTLSLVVKQGENAEKGSQLLITIEWISSGTTLPRKELCIRLTDERDPSFFLCLTITEEDFHVLKSQQGLLVDFATFPQKFINLLELCHAEKGKEHPRYVLHLGMHDEGLLTGRHYGQLEIVERNEFKHLCHLSLKLPHGNDAQIKTYLKECLLQVQGERDELQHKLHLTENQLSEQLRVTKEELRNKTYQVDSLQRELHENTTKLTSKHSQEINSERSRSQENESRIQRQYEDEKKEMELKHARISQQLEARLAGLEAHNRDLSDKKLRAESSARDMKSRVSLLEEELSGAREELRSLRTNYGSKEANWAKKQEELHQLNTRTAVLQQQLKDKEDILRRNQEMLDIGESNKKRLESDVQKLTGTVARREKSLKEASEEMEKGNSVIRKLQEERKANQTKIAFQSQKMSELRQRCEEKEGRCDALEKKIEKLEEKVKQLTGSKEERERELKEAQDANHEQEKVIRTKENLIAYLNKQLNYGSSKGTNPSYSSLPYSTPLGAGVVPPTLNTLGSSIAAQQSTNLSNVIPRKPITPPQEATSSDKENKTPSLDPKYFQPTDVAASRGILRVQSPTLPEETPTGIRPRHEVLTTRSEGGAAPTNRGRRSAPNTKVPLSSAYFPR